MVVAAAAVLAILALAILLRQSRNQPRPAFLVLAALPFALLLLVTAVPFSALRTIRAFQEIGANGHSGMSEIAGVLVKVSRSLAFGSAGAIVVLAFAIAATVSPGRAEAASGPPIAVPDRAHWGRWILAASSLLVVAAAILTFLMRSTEGLIMRVGVQLTTPSAQIGLDQSAMEQYSRTIAGRLVIAMLIGFASMALMLVFGIANVFAARAARDTDAFRKFSWAVVGLAGVLLIWTLVATSIYIRMFERLVAAR